MKIQIAILSLIASTIFGTSEAVAQVTREPASVPRTSALPEPLLLDDSWEKWASGIGQIFCSRPIINNDFPTVSVATFISMNNGARNVVIATGHFNGYKTKDSLGNKVVGYYEPHKDCQFYLIDRAGRSLFKSNIKSFTLGGKNLLDWNSGDNDWAIIELEKNAPDYVHLYKWRSLLLNEVKGKVKVFVVGYFPYSDRLDRNRRYYSDCSVELDKSYEFESDHQMYFVHFCYVEVGASGSPIFLRDQTGTYLVGINSGIDYKNSTGIGVRIANSLYDKLMEVSTFAARRANP